MSWLLVKLIFTVQHVQNTTYWYTLIAHLFIIHQSSFWKSSVLFFVTPMFLLNPDNSLICQCLDNNSQTLYFLYIYPNLFVLMSCRLVYLHHTPNLRQHLISWDCSLHSRFVFLLQCFLYFPLFIPSFFPFSLLSGFLSKHARSLSL